jgi:putative membrane protein
MIYHDALLSYVHFFFAFILFGTLAAEAFVLRLAVTGETMRLLTRIDLFYGLAAVGVLIAGVGRVFGGAKGAGYYAGEPFFWAKLVAFLAVGLISIVPTMTFTRWRNASKADASFAPGADAVKQTQRLVLVEVLVFSTIPLFAALMARGIGAG